MHFIERLFHVSPDGGSGATEVAYLIVVLAVGLGLAYRRRIALAIRRMRGSRE